VGDATFKRSRLIPAATSAAIDAASRSFGVTWTPARWNAAPTATAPAVWPSSRAVASMPPAAPDRGLGAALTIVRLLGDWKKPKPRPHTAIRQAIEKSLGCAPSRDRKNKPAAN